MQTNISQNCVELFTADHVACHLPVQLGEGVVDEALPPGEAAQLGDDGQLLLHALVCTVDTLQLPSQLYTSRVPPFSHQYNTDLHNIE